MMGWTPEQDADIQQYAAHYEKLGYSSTVARIIAEIQYGDDIHIVRMLIDQQECMIKEVLDELENSISFTVIDAMPVPFSLSHLFSRNEIISAASHPRGFDVQDSDSGPHRNIAEVTDLYPTDLPSRKGLLTMSPESNKLTTFLDSLPSYLRYVICWSFHGFITSVCLYLILQDNFVFIIKFCTGVSTLIGVSIWGFTFISDRTFIRKSYLLWIADCAEEARDPNFGNDIRNKDTRLHSISQSLRGKVKLLLWNIMLPMSLSPQ